jgi:hypothetical protein
MAEAVKLIMKGGLLRMNELLRVKNLGTHCVVGQPHAAPPAQNRCGVMASQPMLLENDKSFFLPRSCAGKMGLDSGLGSGVQDSLSRLERAEEAPLRLLLHLIARLIPSNLVACRHDEGGHQRQWRSSRV